MCLGNQQERGVPPCLCFLRAHMEAANVEGISMDSGVDQCGFKFWFYTLLRTQAMYLVSSPLFHTLVVTVW